MADNAVSAETLLGVAGVGVGVLLLYGAYKNVPIFGKQGIITQAIVNGKFPTAANLPPLFAGADTGAWASIAGAEAIISSHDPTLGSQIASALKAWNPASDPNGSAELRQLLAQASAKGGAEQQAAETIRNAMTSIAAHTGVQTPSVDTPTGSTKTVNI